MATSHKLLLNPMHFYFQIRVSMKIFLILIIAYYQSTTVIIKIDDDDDDQAFIGLLSNTFIDMEYNSIDHTAERVSRDSKI